jgi:hypothetical protein
MVRWNWEGLGFFNKMFNGIRNWFSEIGDGFGNANRYQPLFENDGLMDL